MPVNVFSDRKILARVYLSKSRETDGIKQKLRASAARIYAVSALSLCAAYIAMLLISIIFIKPIDEITKGAREIGSGNLAYRIKLKRNDELGQMGTELNEMAEKLSELEKIKEDFTSAITHDLRSPVTAIKLAAGNITKEYINGKHIRIPEQVFSIEENAERLNRLIDSILKVAKIESGKDTMSVKPVNIEDTLANIIDGNRPYAKSKNISLDLIVENTIADITADPEKLEQAFSNIIINSLKFTKEGFVNVYIRSDNGAQEVRIADSGHGIANRDLKHIFEKFYKGKNSEKGLGLGLYITKKIVDMHGGTMEVKSVLGKGTEFTVRLPSNGGSAAKKQGIAS
jgi:signal transduction histidine kinase